MDVEAELRARGVEVGRGKVSGCLFALAANPPQALALRMLGFVPAGDVSQPTCWAVRPADVTIGYAV